MESLPHDASRKRQDCDSSSEDHDNATDVLVGRGQHQWWRCLLEEVNINGGGSSMVVGPCTAASG